MENKNKRKPSEFSRFAVADLYGRTWEITASDFADCEIFSGTDNPLVYAKLKQFVENELSTKTDTGIIPKHVTYMKTHNLMDYCEVSEKGHFRWFPNGVLIQKLILEYAANLAREWGAIEMQNPIIIKGDHNLIGQLMGEFHERDYRVDGGRGTCYLRYASDPLAFPFMQKIRFKQKHSPLKVYEEANCFRNEQDGEVSGLKRVRGFTMTDMHAACSSEEEAKYQFRELCLKFGQLMNDITRKGRWVLGWEGTIDFYEEHKDWLVGIGKEMQVPAFFKLMEEMSHYYSMKNEYQFINQDNSNVQVSTVQWDIKDGERFGIGYTDENETVQPCPVIIHASSFGSIERALCAILENIAFDIEENRAPGFPFWLAPTQIRLIPVADTHIPYCLQLSRELARYKVRIDIDDRDATVGKKIRNGEQEWIPYLLVIGEQEQTGGTLSVRSRESRKQTVMTKEEFISLVHTQTGEKPFRHLTLPELISSRPVFV